MHADFARSCTGQRLLRLDRDCKLLKTVFRLGTRVKTRRSHRPAAATGYPHGCVATPRRIATGAALRSGLTGACYVAAVGGRFSAKTAMPPGMEPGIYPGIRARRRDGWSVGQPRPGTDHGHASTRDANNAGTAHEQVAMRGCRKCPDHCLGSCLLRSELKCPQA